MKVVLLCGGYGTRLGEETQLKPKPMVEIGGKPILWHIMKIFEKHDIQDFQLALGYKADIIKDYFLKYNSLNNDFSVNLKSGKIEFNDIINEKPSEYWLSGLDKIKIACGPINRIDQAFENPQVQSREMEIEMQHPATGDLPVKLIGSPINMSETPVSYRRPPPMLGEHTDEILKEFLELEPDDCSKLRQKGII